MTKHAAVVTETRLDFNVVSIALSVTCVRIV